MENHLKFFELVTITKEQQAEVSRLKKELVKLESAIEIGANIRGFRVVFTIGDQSLMYELKKEYRHIEPAHYACPNCWEEQCRSIMQKISIHAYEYPKYSCRIGIKQKSTYDQMEVLNCVGGDWKGGIAR